MALSCHLKKPILENLLLITKRLQIWLLSFYVATLYCSFDTLAALWGIPYLQGTYNLSLTQATSIASTIFVGGIFGFLFPLFFQYKELKHCQQTLILL